MLASSLIETCSAFPPDSMVQEQIYGATLFPLASEPYFYTLYMLNLVTYLARVSNSHEWVELKMVLGSAFVGTLTCAQDCNNVFEHCLLYWVTFFA